MDTIVTIAASVAINQAVDIFNNTREHLAAIVANNFLLIPRLNSELKVLHRAKELLRENNIEPQALNLKLLAPLIENAILEEDDLLQELWSRLILSYVDPSKHYNSVVFINILKELTKEEVMLLIEFNIKKQLKIAEIRSFDSSISIINIINLERFDLIHRPIGLLAGGPFEEKDGIKVMISDDLTKYPFGHIEYSANLPYLISPLGIELLKSVGIN